MHGTWSHGHMVTWSHGHMVTWSPSLLSRALSVCFPPPQVSKLSQEITQLTPATLATAATAGAPATAATAPPVPPAALPPGLVVPDVYALGDCCANPANPLPALAQVRMV